MFPFGRTYRLHERGGAGICCDADGVSLGLAVLVERVQKNYFLRPAEDIIDALEAAYGPVGQVAADDLAQKIAGIARSLNDGNMPHAMLKTLYLRLPEIPPENLAKMNRVVMRKANPGRRVDRAAAEIAAGDLAVGLSRALQMSLPEAKAKMAASDLEKFNPWHDLLGMFTDAAHAAANSVVASANAAEAPRGARSPGRLAHKEIKKLVSENNRSKQSDELITAIAYKESRFDPAAKSKISTATGLMQMTKPALKDLRENNLGDYSLDDMKNPVKNIRAATTYLQLRIKAKDGNVFRALSGYGNGDGYARSVLAAEKALKESPSDPLGALQRTIGE